MDPGGPAGPRRGLVPWLAAEQTTRVESPEIRYARSGDVHIAYSVVGDGPIDVVFVSGWVLSNFGTPWEGTAVDFYRGVSSFTDIVNSTAMLAEVGDRNWRGLIEQHHALVRRQLVRYSGREIDTAGDGFFASFDGPARAIRCARAISDGVRELGLHIRAGLHTGECEITDGNMTGIAVHIGARVAAEAQPDEVVVSSTVRDLVAGSGLKFHDRGYAQLKGLPGEWRLYSVDPSVI